MTADQIAEPFPMTPGEYLRRRREAAGLTIEDVAEFLTGVPRMVRHDRHRELDRDLLSLEQGSRDLSESRPDDLVDQLGCVFAFDLQVYRALVDEAANVPERLPFPPVCRLCACSWQDPCVDRHGAPCGWMPVPAGIYPDLCNHCARHVGFLVSAFAMVAASPSPVTFVGAAWEKSHAA